MEDQARIVMSNGCVTISKGDVRLEFYTPPNDDGNTIISVESAEKPGASITLNRDILRAVLEMLVKPTEPDGAQSNEDPVPECNSENCDDLPDDNFFNCRIVNDEGDSVGGN